MDEQKGLGIQPYRLALRYGEWSFCPLSSLQVGFSLEYLSQDVRCRYGDRRLW